MKMLKIIGWAVCGIVYSFALSEKVDDRVQSYEGERVTIVIGIENDEPVVSSVFYPDREDKNLFLISYGMLTNAEGCSYSVSRDASVLEAIEDLQKCQLEETNLLTALSPETAKNCYSNVPQDLLLASIEDSPRCTQDDLEEAFQVVLNHKEVFTKDSLSPNLSVAKEDHEESILSFILGLLAFGESASAEETKEM